MKTALKVVTIKGENFTETITILDGSPVYVGVYIHQNQPVVTHYVAEELSRALEGLDTLFIVYDIDEFVYLLNANPASVDIAENILARVKYTGQERISFSDLRGFSITSGTALYRPLRISDPRNDETIGYGIPSPDGMHIVYVTRTLLENKFNSDKAAAYENIRTMQVSQLLPRVGSANRPLSEYDMKLYKRNVQLNRQYWKWISSSGESVKACTSLDAVWGYGYYTDRGFVIVDEAGEPRYTVE